MDSVLNLLVLAALTPIAYNFPLGAKRAYELQATFDGYVPFLGGRQAIVQVNMGIEVQGLTLDDRKRTRVASELTAVKLLYNGAPMPMDLNNVRTYFPRTTISMSPQGKVLKTDAPDVELPVRLPGLDAKRFPDISYLPIEFPEEGIEQGVEWTFKKNLGGTLATYSVKPVKVGDDRVDLEIRIEQTYQTLEDKNHNPIAAEKDAALVVATVLSGKGTAIFDRKLGAITLFAGDTEADSTVTDKATQKKSQRKLHTTLRVKLLD